MKIKELKIAVIGPVFPIKEFEIEGVSVLEKREYGDDEVSVSVKDFDLSDDGELNIHIHQTGPNGNTYTVKITGKVIVDGSTKKIEYESEEFTTKFGKIRIDINEPINDLLK